MRALILVMVVLITISPVYAQTGLGMMEVPDGSISAVNTKIEAKIENWGYYKIFVALPDGWVPDVIGTYAQSYAVREEQLWRIYGMPYDKKSLLGMGEVFTQSQIQYWNPVKAPIQIGSRYGWWIKPNEGMQIYVKVDDIEGTGKIDPLKIEKENPSIKVKKWYQQFTLELAAPGFITAPWIVEQGTLTESNIAPYSSTIGKEKVYYEKYTGADYSGIPDWDEWFETKSPYGFALSPTPLEIELEYYPEKIEQVEAAKTPIWRVELIADIVYAYEWQRDTKIEGITFWRDTLKSGNAPDWFDWF